jgi:glycosyltransferase involved in cell wall biosynthesis
MDPQSQVLAWQTKVAFSLATYFDKVIVVTHQQKNIDTMPGNVTIIVLPSFFLRAPMRWLGGKYCLNVWLWKLHSHYHFDRCFVHMNFEWALWFAPFFKIKKIPVIVWYAHGSVTKLLKKTLPYTDKILTSTKEGFRINSDKVVIIGQSIDTELFPLHLAVSSSGKIIYVGRISPVKNIERLIEIMEILVIKRNQQQFSLTIIGLPLTQTDRKYYEDLKMNVRQKGLESFIRFQGQVSNNKIPEYYSDTFLHLSCSNTGSMDKTLMEALACGCPVLTTNIALFDIIEEKYKIKSMDSHEVADQVMKIYDEQLTIDRNKIRSIVINGHSYDQYIIKMKDNIINTLR